MLRYLRLSDAAYNRMLDIMIGIVSDYKRAEQLDLNEILTRFNSHANLPKAYKFSHDRMKKEMIATIKSLVKEHNEKAANMSDEDRRYYEMIKL